MKVSLAFVFFATRTSVVLATGASCKGLDTVCDNDSDCCGHPDNKAIRCENRNALDGKRCYVGRTNFGPCTDNSQCLSQHCVNGVCLPPLNRPAVKVDFCSLGTSNDIKEAVNGVLPKCACEKAATDSLALAMDGDLSTDYTNFHSKGYSGLIFEPSLKAPLREFEVCSSNQDLMNDPMCYSLYGEGKDEPGVYSLIQHGILALPRERQQCKQFAIKGRHCYSRYKLDFGCRRGAYDELCLDESTEPPCNPAREGHEIRPKGKDETCTPLFDADGATVLSPLFPHSIEYDEANDVTLYTYMFLNKFSGDGPELSHAIVQYMGACSVSQVRIYTIENGSEVPYFTTNSPGDHLQNPKSTVCMSGVDLPGVEGGETYYFELTVDGYFPRTSKVDYVLKGGEFLKYGQTQGPDCRCTVTARRALGELRSFRGLPKDLTPRKAGRRLSCVDMAMSVSEVKFNGKCNEG